MRREDLEVLTKQDLLELARKLGIPGRSSLSKDGLVKAVLKAQSRERKPIFGKSASKGVRPAARGPRTAAARDAKVAAPRDVKRSKPSDTKASASRSAKPSPPSRPDERRPVAAAKPASSQRKVAAPVKAVAPVKAAAPKAAAPAKTVVPAKAKAAVKPAKPAKPVAPPQAPRSEEPEERRSEVAREPELRRTPRGAPLHMPDEYGIDRIALMARDPYWLHAYWEVTPTAVDRMRAKLGDEWRGSRTVLRVYDYPPGTPEAKASSDDGENRYDIDLPAGSNSWYINVGRPDRAYRAAVGVISRSGRFHAYARSNMVSTPRDSISTVTDEEWAISPEAFNRLYELASPERHGGGRASAELGMLLRERLRSDWASGMLASMGSGELLAQKQAPRGFWFILDAELIVYGATEPDATVTVQGKPVQLRPDGTFSLRFLLPDGTQVIDATAVSADGVFRKTITPTVRRETSATEMIESKPSARR